MDLFRRDDDEPVHVFVNPYKELNIGLWSLFAGASLFLGLRIFVKLKWRYGLWYDDYMLILCWGLLIANNALIVHEFATGYVLPDSSHSWDDRMRILINITSCGTLINQAWTKTAFGATLLRISNRWQGAVIWFCIVTMNVWMIAKVILQWAKLCGRDDYQQSYRLDFCVTTKFRDDFKEGGNVWNIIMDFVFATFPWILTYGVDMRRVEKIGLCVTMSLGITVAIQSAIRVAWKDDGNNRDQWYIWRNGLSQIWYSSEIAGTILVQCIPVLRPILRNFSSTVTSTQRWSGTTDAHRSVANRLSSRTMSKEFTTYDIKCQGSDESGLRPLQEAVNRKWKSERPLSTVVDVEEDQRSVSVESWPLNNRSVVDIELGKVYHAK